MVCDDMEEYRQYNFSRTSGTDIYGEPWMLKPFGKARDNSDKILHLIGITEASLFHYVDSN